MQFSNQSKNLFGAKGAEKRINLFGAEGAEQRMNLVGAEGADQGKIFFLKKLHPLFQMFPPVLVISQYISFDTQ